MKKFYVVIMGLGLIISYSIFIPFFADHGMDMSLMINQAFANRISSVFAIDLILSAIVAIVFMIYQGRKIKLKFYWIPIACTILIGLSFGLPLYLYLREVHLNDK